MALNDPLPESSASLLAIHRRLVACAKATAGVDIRPFEGRTADELKGELVPMVQAHLKEAIALSSLLLARFDKEESDEVLSSEPATDAKNRRQIGDLAFLGLLEFSHRMEPHRISTMEDGWDVVAECGVTLRRIAKVFGTLEVPLAALAGCEPALDLTSELLTSLEIRRQYARLCRTIDSVPVPAHPAAMVKALRGVGTAIAMLVGREVYPELRIFDRRQIRALQTRIIEWLREASSPDAMQTGTRLWHDLLGTAEILMQINRREDLNRHDVETLRILLERPDRGRDSAELRSLRGLDPELDGLIARGADADVHALTGALERLASRFRVATAGENAADSPFDGPASGFYFRPSDEDDLGDGRPSASPPTHLRPTDPKAPPAPFHAHFSRVKTGI